MEPVVPIGPQGVGTSSVAWRLSARRGQPDVPLDEVRWFHVVQAGLDILEQDRIRQM